MLIFHKPSLPICFALCSISSLQQREFLRLSVLGLWEKGREGEQLTGRVWGCNCGTVLWSVVEPSVWCYLHFVDAFLLNGMVQRSWKLIEDDSWLSLMTIDREGKKKKRKNLRCSFQIWVWKVTFNCVILLDRFRFDSFVFWV